jgi:hypothetical protein
MLPHAMPSPKNQEKEVYPANIVATRRLIFSPPNILRRTTTARTRSSALLNEEKGDSPSSNKENSAENARDRTGLRAGEEPTKPEQFKRSFSFSDAAIGKPAAAEGSSNDSDAFSQTLVRLRNNWLQQRVFRSNSFSGPSRVSKEGSIRKKKELRSVDAVVETSKSEFFCNQNRVATKQKPASPGRDVSIFVVPDSKGAPPSLQAMKPKQPSEAKPVPKPPLKSASTVKQEGGSQEACQPTKSCNRNAQTLVKERARWLQRQVDRNELFLDVPSDDEDDKEKRKTDLQLRLEAFEKELQRLKPAVVGVPPRRSLAELP